ncbi:MAG: hypothetical protein H6672_13140 [Anaerolineaceae bacterium]|nr:hypothetical protein [Anaerolineaceae bacterium]
MKPERRSDVQSQPDHTSINLLGVYRSLLRIVARLDETGYTGSNPLLRQTEVVEHSDLADPASDRDTSPG